MENQTTKKLHEVYNIKLCCLQVYFRPLFMIYWRDEHSDQSDLHSTLPSGASETNDSKMSIRSFLLQARSNNTSEKRLLASLRL
jgi:hypothetical protein